MRLRVGVTCHPGYGGSGVVATEVGLAMAARGHEVHFICTETPQRLVQSSDRVTVHLAQAAEHPVLAGPAHTIALASTLIEVAEAHHLDLIHGHYAVPHAVTAWMAREAVPGLKTVVTLHGTDVTSVGNQRSYRAMVQHGLRRSDAITAPSVALSEAAQRIFVLDRAIEVIPNFVQAAVFRPTVPGDEDALSAIFGGAGAPVVVHVSNFREVKQPVAVVEIFARILQQTPARLLMIGDGPQRPAVEAAIDRLGVRAQTRLLGAQRQFEGVLRQCALFLLPSRAESFGLAALEALASGVPVIASDVGGLREVVEHGQTGVLVAADDPDRMAREAVRLLSDGAARQQMAAAGRADVLARFCSPPLVDRYEALYRRILA